MIGFSIIICCYNSELRISKTLFHISKLQIESNLLCEVILINNNSIDNTTILAEKEWIKYGNPFQLKIVDELTPGLSSARIKGVKTAKYDYIIFCDDDNWLDANYISIAFRIMEDNERIGVLGGQGLEISDIPFPDWFEEVKEDYAVGRQGKNSGDISSRGYIWGSGMVLRRRIILGILETGIESKLSDRKGANLSSGGDSELSAWHVLFGFKLWYDERLKYFHFIPQERLTKDYYSNLAKGHDESFEVLKYYFRLIQFVQSKHIVHLDFLFSIYLTGKYIYFRVINKKVDFLYLSDMIQLYFYHVFKFNSPIIEFADNIFSRIKKAKD